MHPNFQRRSHNAVESRCDAVKICKILNEWLQYLGQNVSQMLDTQKTPHTSPSRASYGVYFVNICEKINRVITAPRSNFLPPSF